jgi:hypothetical protein
VLQQALYGARHISVPGIPAPPQPEPSEEMLPESEEHQGLFRLRNNNRVSAVAVLWLESVNKKKWADHLDPYLKGLDFREAGHAILELEPRLRPEFEKIHGPINKELIRLALYHNPFAREPLSQKAFAVDEHCYQLWYDSPQRQFLCCGKLEDNE